MNNTEYKQWYDTEFVRFVVELLEGLGTPEEELQNLRRVSSFDNEEVVWEQ